MNFIAENLLAKRKKDLYLQNIKLSIPSETFQAQYKLVEALYSVGIDDIAAVSLIISASQLLTPGTSKSIEEWIKLKSYIENSLGEMGDDATAEALKWFAAGEGAEKIKEKIEPMLSIRPVSSPRL
jgi:hypothetical protein